jgi:Leu/Phe-tRNA-protein transferase
MTLLSLSTTDKDYIYKDGILFWAVDNCPTEFPKEASNWFGDNLLRFIPDLVNIEYCHSIASFLLSLL